MWKWNLCPLCKNDTNLRVIYAGFPMWLCFSEDCRCVHGFWTFILLLLPFNGVFFAYNHEKMAYPVALYHWLFDKDIPEIHE